MGYTPNGWSLREVHTRTERFVACTTCRQAGKTMTVAAEIDKGMTEKAHPIFGPPIVAVVGPEYAKAEAPVMRWYEWVTRAFGPEYAHLNSNKHEITIPTTGAKLIWLSASNIESLIGHTVSLLLIDESQLVPDDSWHVLYPVTSVRNAPIRAFGTPDITPDQSWFRGLWMRGQDEDEPNYHSYTLDCYSNIWMSAEEIDIAQRTLSSRMFRMLYLGEWVDVEGSVFQNLEAALLPDEEIPYVPGREYYIAIDPAVYEDYTVCYLGEPGTGRVVKMDRWHRTDLVATYDRIQRFWETYGRPPVYMDETGVGAAVLVELQRRGIKVFGLGFNAANKMPLVQKLANDIEHGRIRFPQWDILLKELRAFVYKETPGGRLTASAAATYHDDCVMALIVANEARKRRGAGIAVQYSYMAGEQFDPTHPKMRMFTSA